MTEETLGAAAGRAKNTRGSDNQCLMKDLVPGGARRKGRGYAEEEEAAEARARPPFILSRSSCEGPLVPGARVGPWTQT